MKLAEVVGRLKISDELKAKYTRMAIVFEDDVEKNITRSHFELERATTIPYDEWDVFLSITEVAGWLNETMRHLARAGERKLIKEMGEGGVDSKDVNAYKAIKEYNAASADIDNSHIVIMYLPVNEEEGQED